MLIEFMRLHNWRAFYGENDLWFSVDPAKNVTVIRAENSVGKTSLLAAINWCFFKQLPNVAEFENPDQLVNDYARLNDGVTQTKIEIEFRHEEKLYRAVRTYDQPTKRTNELKLSELTEDGEIPLTGTDSQKFINSVIPQEMAPHFFFYGEHSSRYMNEGAARHFAKAVRSILGATVANMALMDIKIVLKDYQKEAAKSTSTEAENITQEIEKIDETIEKLEADFDKLELEEQTAQDTIDRLSASLANSSVIKEDQKNRATLERRHENYLSDLQKALVQQKSWLNKYGMSVLASDVVEDARKLLDTEDTKKKIPGPYNEKFVNELLADGTCVCGRDLKEGSEEFDRVSSLLKNATDEIVMSRIMTTGHLFGSLDKGAQNAWDIFKRNEEDLIRINNDINNTGTALNEISERLSRHDVSDIGEKEQARVRAQDQRKNASNRRSEIRANIIRLEKVRDDRIRKQNELMRQSEGARRFVRKSQVAESLMRRLGSRLQQEEELAREAIQSRITDIIEKFMRRPLVAQLDKNYQLSLFDENGLEAAKSTGEKQLLGLAFTAAIAHHAKNREHESSDLLLSGTEAPLVVDSPFGHLDPEYRKAVSTFLPQLASQVVLLVSRTQAQHVIETLADRIGVQYVLTRYNTIPKGERPTESVVIDGAEYPLSAYDSNFSGTVLTEVTGK